MPDSEQVRVPSINHPKVSICIPTYNHERFIGQALESALSQHTDFAYEILVSDDCSTDRTPEIALAFAGRYSDRVRVFRQQKNLGMDGNWRYLLRIANGEYISVLDGDDYYSATNKVEKQVEALSARADLSACFHLVEIQNETTGEIAVSPFDSDCMNGKDFSVLDWPRQTPATSALMFRREVVDFALSERCRKVPMSEVPLLFIAAMQGGIGVIPERMSRYRIHPGGRWNGRTMFLRYEKMVAMISSMLSAELLVSEEVRGWLRTLLDYNVVKLSVHANGAEAFFRSVQGNQTGDISMSWPLQAACEEILKLQAEINGIRGSVTFRLGQRIVNSIPTGLRSTFASLLRKSG